MDNANTTILENITPADLKAWAAAHRGVVKAHLALVAFAELEAERVAAYIAPVFAKFSFVSDALEGSHPITDPEDLYLSDDEEQMGEYYAACDVAHRLNGFTGPEGWCPSGMAKTAVISSENDLVKAFEKFTGFTGYGRYPKIRANVLELILKVCLSELI